MMKKAALWALAVVLLNNAGAQEMHPDAAKQCAAGKIDAHRTLAKTTVASPLEEGYDVKYVKLDLAMSNQNTTLSGNALTKAVVLAANFPEYVFELDPQLTIDSVKIDGQGSAWSSSGSVRTATLAAPLSAGALFTAQVFYHGTPVSGTAFNIRGINTLTSPTWNTQVTFTLSQPYKASYWWPCKQALLDKIDSADIWLTVPSALKAGSNGVLQGVTLLSGNRSRYEWKHRRPIDYYLVSAAVAPYTDYSYYVTFPGSTDSVLVQNYVYSNPQTLPFWKDEIDSTGHMLLFFSDLFGRYPFWQEKYGHCMAPFSGGMEHQTMTTQGNFEGTLTAHELAHQWFGDHVTCASWKDIWLNEGFASYAEYLFVKQFRGNIAAGSYMQNVHQDIMFDQTGNFLPDGAVYVDDTTSDERIFDGRLSYNKGSAVVHMLRYVAPADSTFFRLLRVYQQQYAFGSATTEQFKALAEQVYGQDLDTFFNQWVYGEGFPSYNMKWNQAGGQVHVSLMQASINPSSVPLFRTPLDIRFTSAQGDTTIRIYNNQAVQNFSFSWTKTISSVHIDPDNWVLNHVSAIDNDPTLSVPGIAAGQVRVQPNPAGDHWTLSGYPGEAEWQLTDLSGRRLAQGRGRGEQRIDASGLSSGVYLLSISKAGNAAVTLKLIKQ